MPGTPMFLSPAGLQWIAHSEGFNPSAYSDHKGRSIGYGHLIKPGEVFDHPLTQEEGIALLNADSAEAAVEVNRAITVPLTQEQFDALVDFRYNLFPLALTNVASTLNTGDYKAAAARMELYNKVHDPNGNLVVSGGLSARRAHDAEPFLA